MVVVVVARCGARVEGKVHVRKTVSYTDTYTLALDDGWPGRGRYAYRFN